MTYATIKARLDAGEILILDGATGTELQRRGVAMDPAAWCGTATLGNDRLLQQIHADYIRAGSDVITANTFASSRLMLDPAGFGDSMEEINRRAVEAALRAREQAADGRTVLVAGSLSHMVPVADGTDKVDPALVPSDAAISDAFHQLASVLKSAGVDHIMLEMMYHPGRIRIAVEAALATGLPVWFGLSARRAADGAILGFDRLEDTPIDEIVALIPPEIEVAGCMHTGSEIVGATLGHLRKGFAGPLMAYPDGGYFEMPSWRFVDVIEPARLELFFGDWIAAGAQLIGGCCGLTIAHIEAAVRARETAQRARRGE